MSAGVIKPTVGRVVWFYPGPYRPQGFTIYDPAQPCSAQIAFVINDTTVNLSVFDHGGRQWGVDHVLLWHGDGERPSDRYCEWMPYQKGQSAKTEQLEAKLAPTR